jgi:hypothetical protein
MILKKIKIILRILKCSTNNFLIILDILVKNLIIKDMESEHIFFQMEVSMMVNDVMEKCVDSGDYIFQIKT